MPSEVGDTLRDGDGVTWEVFLCTICCIALIKRKQGAGGMGTIRHGDNKQCRPCRATRARAAKKFGNAGVVGAYGAGIEQMADMACGACDAELM